MSKADISIEMDAAEYVIRTSGDTITVGQFTPFSPFEPFDGDELHLVSTGGLMICPIPVDHVIDCMLHADEVVEVCWTDNEVLGECLAITYQCPSHPEDPLDRGTHYLTNVRPGRGPTD